MRSVRTKPNQMAIDGANRYFYGNRYSWNWFVLDAKDHYKAYQQWNKAQMFYNNKAYEAALEVYEPLYPLLKHKPEFLFEVAQCLSKTGRYEKANGYLERAVLLSSDPMLYYVMAKMSSV